MTTRERLHALIDELPDDRLEQTYPELIAVIERERTQSRTALREALNDLFGSFQAEDYPYWATDDQVLEWVRTMREDRPNLYPDEVEPDS